MTDSSPHMLKRQLGSKLAMLRRQAGKIQEDVAVAQICCVATLRNIENGTSKGQVKAGTVLDLLLFYGVEPGPMQWQLADMARHTGIKGWYQQNDAWYTQQTFLLLDLEQIASSIYSYEGTFIHGYFQTKSYIQALVEGARMGARSGIRCLDADEIADGRSTRYQRLTRRMDAGMTVHCVMGFASLLNQVGNAEVMAEQIAVLREADQHPNLSISIVPQEAGAHPCLGRSLIILDVDDPRDPSVAYDESGGTQPPRYIDDATEVERYRGMFNATEERSIPLKRYLDEH